MTIIGHGVDLVEIERIDGLLRDHGDRFARRCFTEAERRYADASRRRRAERYAARFACKEAVLKALGTGWRDGIAWTDVAVARRPSGAPELRLGGRCRELADQLGIRRWHISLSHVGRYAMASAIGSGTKEPSAISHQPSAGGRADS
jgi:holo-[acyl-carrier protein] synthase